MFVGIVKFLFKKEALIINNKNCKALIKVDGLEALLSKYSYAISSSTLYSNSSCGLPNKDYFDIIRGFDTSDFPWPGNLKFI